MKNKVRLNELELTILNPVTCGDINRVHQVCDNAGNSYLLKQQRQEIDGFFQAEAHGLQTLKATQQIRVPDVIEVSGSGLLLEWIESGHWTSASWHQAGQELALLHSLKQDSFGLEQDNFCGLTAQKNSPMSDGFQFFAENRLLFQTGLAIDSGLLGRTESNGIEAICNKLPELIPRQAPALLHGDLWSGNIMVSSDHRPVFIDPACYRGWPEADIAMTRLFGGFPEQFYESYYSMMSKAEGFENRKDLYNLYHLLNHLNLFGKSYLAQVKQIISAYK